MIIQSPPYKLCKSVCSGYPAFFSDFTMLFSYPCCTGTAMPSTKERRFCMKSFEEFTSQFSPEKYEAIRNKIMENH